MGTGTFWFVGAVCLATFGVLLRFAVQALEDRRYRISAAWFFWSFVPLAVVCAILVIRGEPDVSEPIRNIVLGLVGAALGASLFVWGGYAVWGTAAAQTSEHKMAQDQPPQVPNISGNNNVVSVGQTGGVTAGTYINQVPQPELN